MIREPTLGILPHPARQTPVPVYFILSPCILHILQIPMVSTIEKPPLKDEGNLNVFTTE